MKNHSTSTNVQIAIMIALTICSTFISGCSSNTNRQVSAFDESAEFYPLPHDGMTALGGSSRLRVVQSPQSSRTSEASPTLARYRIRTRNQSLQPPTGKQLFGQWIGKAMAAVLIALAVLIFLCPSAMLAFGVNRFRAIRAALSETVAGIHLSDAVARDAKLAAFLKASQSPATRTIVKEMKAEA